MSRPKDPFVFVNHIWDAIQDLKKYYRDTGTYERFLDDVKTQDAIVRKLEIIGEAAKNLAPEFMNTYPELNLKGPIGLRNVLIHDYFDLDLAAVWDILDKDLPVLESQIKRFLEEKSGQ